jgi:SAM-dependent methyltransferase
MTLLDVGCGPGSITLDLASVVAPGLVTGVDVAPVAIDAARAAAAERGTTNVRFVEADVHRPPVEPGSMDVVHAHQLLQHLADPVGALRAMAAATKPGGLVATRDSDYGAMTWHPADPQLDRWRELYRAVARANGGEPDAARRLPEWTRRAGLHQAELNASTWLFATPEDRAWWGTQWAQRTIGSAFGRRGVELGLATNEDLYAMADGWHRWAAHRDAWFLVPHGEMLARVGSAENEFKRTEEDRR